MALRDQPGVYFVRCTETGLVKIGRSVSVLGRVRQLGHRNALHRGAKVDVRPVAAVYVREPKVAEKYLHYQLKIDGRQRTHPRLPSNTEWFELSNQEVARAVGWALDMTEWHNNRVPEEYVEAVYPNVHDDPKYITRRRWPQHEHRPGAFVDRS